MEINIWNDIYAVIMEKSALCHFFPEKKKNNLFKFTKRNIWPVYLFENELIEFKSSIVILFKRILLTIECVILVLFVILKRNKEKKSIYFWFVWKVPFDSLERFNTPSLISRTHIKYFFIIFIELIHCEYMYKTR